MSEDKKVLSMVMDPMPIPMGSAAYFWNENREDYRLGEFCGQKCMEDGETIHYVDEQGDDWVNVGIKEFHEIPLPWQWAKKDEPPKHPLKECIILSICEDESIVYWEDFDISCESLEGGADIVKFLIVPF